jgi:hypothetical protein
MNTRPCIHAHTYTYLPAGLTKKEILSCKARILYWNVALLHVHASIDLCFCVPWRTLAHFSAAPYPCYTHTHTHAHSHSQRQFCSRMISQLRLTHAHRAIHIHMHIHTHTLAKHRIFVSTDICSTYSCSNTCLCLYQATYAVYCWDECIVINTKPFRIHTCEKYSRPVLYRFIDVCTRLRIGQHNCSLHIWRGNVSVILQVCVTSAEVKCPSILQRGAYIQRC